jgi:phosphatidylserine decarboxylase
VVDSALASQLEGGAYATVYLSPRDYHRVHAPVSGTVIGYDYVPGSLHPVNPLFADNIENLFAANERVVIRLDTDAGPVAVVMVAALGVGNVELTIEPTPLQTRHLRRLGERRCVRFDRPVSVQRGDELAAFRLGSTVILVLPPPSAALADDIVAGTTVRAGERIAEFSAAPVAVAPDGANQRSRLAGDPS